MSTTILQHHKTADQKNIRHKFDMDAEKKSFVLSEGSPESFKADTWAEIISGTFARSPFFRVPEFLSSMAACAQQFRQTKFEYNEDPAIADIEKKKQPGGGTASIIAVQYDEEKGTLDIISCGNSNVFIIRNSTQEDATIACFPYDIFDALDTNRHFLNSEELLRGKVDSHFFKNKRIVIDKTDTIILASNFLSRMLLRKKELHNASEVLKELIAINDYSTLHRFCLKHKQRRELEDEEVSVAIIKMEAYEVVRKILPPVHTPQHMQQQQHELHVASHTAHNKTVDVEDIPAVVINVEEQEKKTRHTSRFPPPREEKHEPRHASSHVKPGERIEKEHISEVIIDVKEQGKKAANLPTHKEEIHKSKHESHMSRERSHKSSGHNIAHYSGRSSHSSDWHSDDYGRVKSALHRSKKKSRLYQQLLAGSLIAIFLLLCAWLYSSGHPDTRPVVNMLPQNETDNSCADRLNVLNDSIAILNNKLSAAIGTEKVVIKKEVINNNYPRAHKHWPRHHSKDVYSDNGGKRKVIKVTKVTTVTTTKWVKKDKDVNIVEDTHSGGSSEQLRYKRIY